MMPINNRSSGRCKRNSSALRRSSSRNTSSISKALELGSRHTIAHSSGNQPRVLNQSTTIPKSRLAAAKSYVRSERRSDNSRPAGHRQKSSVASEIPMMVAALVIPVLGPLIGGTQRKGPCPYCGKLNSIVGLAAACTHCKKQIAVKDKEFTSLERHDSRRMTQQVKTV